LREALASSANPTAMTVMEVVENNNPIATGTAKAESLGRAERIRIFIVVIPFFCAQVSSQRKCCVE
jgi:hypothetical protein